MWTTVKRSWNDLTVGYLAIDFLASPHTYSIPLPQFEVRIWSKGDGDMAVEYGRF